MQFSVVLFFVVLGWGAGQLDPDPAQCETSEASLDPAGDPPRTIPRFIRPGGMANQQLGGAMAQTSNPVTPVMDSSSAVISLDQSADLSVTLGSEDDSKSFLKILITNHIMGCLDAISITLG